MVFANKPVLVFWETTRACPLNCVHCRADAIENPLPGELTTEEGKSFIDQVATFGKPAPLIIFTGGDPLKRKDLYELLAYARSMEINFAVSPAVSESLTQHVLERLKLSGVSSISVSLDGAEKSTHDSIRKLGGTYDRTIEIIRKATAMGLPIQVNSVVMEQNISELPAMFKLLSDLGIRTWEVFFLIKTGRGSEVRDISARDSESVCNFLYDVSKRNMVVRTVEAPFIRRVAKQRMADDGYWRDATYLKMRSELASLDDGQRHASTIRPVGTLDGDGIVFVAHDGTISPGGLLPISVGNVKKDSLVEVYKNNDIFAKIRGREIDGPCGECTFRQECGGSRARSYAYYENPLVTDPACFHAQEMLAAKQ